MVQVSHPYMTTGKTTALTRWNFVGKVTSLHFNTLSRFIIAFLPRGKSRYLIVESANFYKLPKSPWEQRTQSYPSVT